jgi:PAS domain S-box-containing protein
MENRDVVRSHAMPASTVLSEPHLPAPQDDARFRLMVETIRDYAIFMLDTEGHVASWSAGAERLNGYAAHEIIGRHLTRFYPPEALARGLPAQELDEAARLGSVEHEGWLVRKDGTRYWANVVVTALRDAQGKLVGYGKVARDHTQRRRHEEDLRLSEERFRLLVEGVPDYAIFLLDVKGHVATWNVGAEHIKGYKADEILGRHFSVFYPPEVLESGWPEHELQSAAQQGSFTDEGWRLRKDGSRFWAGVTITALRDAQQRLVGFAKLTRDLTERKRAEAIELRSREREEILDAERSARMEAQRATRIKDEFLATLSHELRTPISAILGWTQVLLKSGDAIAASERRRAIEVIDRNARSQVHLIDDLLDLSRIMAGKVRLDLQQISIDDVVQAAIDSARPTADAREIELKYVFDPIPATVNADPSRVQQVVWNLLTNAIKFTPKGGRVQVLLQRVNSHVELSVSDTGIGIAPEYLPHVFDRFSQRDSSTGRTYGGLGLGLAICKQLVELHGGSIRVSSRGEGQGATFLVHLPLSIVQVHSEQMARMHPTATNGASDPTALPTLSGVHIFVVDDEPDARELLRRVLEGQDAVVTAFDSGPNALEALKSAKPDVILSDVGMPQMDGYQFMRLFRASEPSAARVPALALTAFARAEDRKRALLAGYQAHIAKPFDIAELVLQLADLVRR